MCNAWFDTHDRWTFFALTDRLLASLKNKFLTHYRPSPQVSSSACIPVVHNIPFPVLGTFFAKDNIMLGTLSAKKKERAHKPVVPYISTGHPVSDLACCDSSLGRSHRWWVSSNIDISPQNSNAHKNQFLFIFISHFYFPASGQAVSQVSPLPPPVLALNCYRA